MIQKNRLLYSILLFILTFFYISYGKIVNVTDFGAVGDEITDDTFHFQNALDFLRKDGGIVFVPSGRYLIKGTLNVPSNVTLEGVFKSAPSQSLSGSVLLTVFGKGEPEGEPFLTLNTNSTINGIIIYYPEQKAMNPPITYPWTIQGKGENCNIKNTLILNPYKAVDFGTYPCGRHFIDGLYAQPLYRGLNIDKCLDVGRISNIHFWPFWSKKNELKEFQEKNAIAFTIGRTDWEYMVNCFCLWYSIGYYFIKSPETGMGNGNVVLTNCGSDLGPVAVKIEEVQRHSGISFVNGQLMGSVIIKKTNNGPIKFTACGFWGTDVTKSLVYNKSSGRTSFLNCQFFWWDREGTGYPAILSQGGDLTVLGCEFGDKDKLDIFLSKKIRTAIISGNTFRTRKGIINKAKRRVKIKNNILSYPKYKIPSQPWRKNIKQKIKEWNK